MVLDEVSSLSFRCQQFIQYLHAAGQETLSAIDPSAIQQVINQIVMIMIMSCLYRRELIMIK